MRLTKKATAFAGLLISRLRGRPFPLVVQIALTNRCNFSCGYCRYYERDSKDPSLSQIEQLIREFVTLGARRFSFVGGEPLLRSDIGQIVSLTKQLGCSVSIITNGALVPRKLDALRPVDDICVSIDGPEQVTDANRVSGAFRHAVRACDALTQAGIPFHLNCVLTKNSASVENVRFLLEFAKQYGTRCSFAVMQSAPETMGDVSSLYAPRAAVLDCLNEIIAAHKRHEPVLFSRTTYQLMRKWPDFATSRVSTNELQGQGYPTCWAGRYFCNVDTDGAVYPCCLTIGEVPAENAYEVGATRALARAAQHQCRHCMLHGWIEYNRFFSLNLESIWHIATKGNV